MKFSRLISAAAAAGMIIAPVVAEAGTRASAARSYTVDAPAIEGARQSASVESDQNFDSGVLLALLALLLIGGGIAIAASQSNG